MLNAGVFLLGESLDVILWKVGTKKSFWNETSVNQSSDPVSINVASLFSSMCFPQGQVGGHHADSERPFFLCCLPVDELSQRQTVKVLSYPQYCRFRSLQRRIQDGARGPALQDPYLLALGAIKVLPNIRVMYCRDTFNHPTLESSACFSWQFSEWNWEPSEAA